MRKYFVMSTLAGQKMENEFYISLGAFNKNNAVYKFWNVNLPNLIP